MKKEDLKLLKKRMQKADQNFYKGTAILLLFIFVCNVLWLVFTAPKLVEAHPELLFANLLLLPFADEVWEFSKLFDNASQEENTTDV